MPDLEVHLYETHVGDLVGDSWRDFDFVPTPDAIELPPALVELGVLMQAPPDRFLRPLPGVSWRHSNVSGS